MMKVYCVDEAHLCDDPYYQASAATVAVYASRESAQANVDAYSAECLRECKEQGWDEEDIWEEYFPKRWVKEVEVQP